MSEPTQQTTIDQSTELETLRRVNQEILTKRQKDKERIAELETASAAAQAEATLAQAAAHEAIIGVPLKRLAEDCSPVPTLWLEKFNESFKVESSDGVLTVLSHEGEPIKDAKGKSVKFSSLDIAHYLTESEPESERTKLFRLITITNRASGAAVVTTGKSQASAPKPAIHFGLC